MNPQTTILTVDIDYVILSKNKKYYNIHLVNGKKLKIPAHMIMFNGKTILFV